MAAGAARQDCRAILLRLAGLFFAAAGAAAPILPPALDCTRSPLSVEAGSAEERGAPFTCPEYFSGRTCCGTAELEAVWAKVEDVRQFVTRVLEDQQKEDLQEVKVEDDGGCGEHYAQLFESRRVHYKQARETVEKGFEILEGATLHFLCAACFVCTVPNKTAQIEEFTWRALQSLQDRMGAIFYNQLVADFPRDPICQVGYAASLREGLAFPSWGRFSPEMNMVDGGLNETFLPWIDRILSMLLELPGSLLYQRSVLQLAFFYADRPDSDAFSLLHYTADGGAVEAEALGMTQAKETFQASASLCPDDAPRLFVFAPRDAEGEELVRAAKALDAEAPAWHVRWIVTAPTHVNALRDVLQPKMMIWRRFRVSDPDGFAASVCGGKPAWVAEPAEAEDISKTAAELQRLGTRVGLEDLGSAGRPSAFRPARPLPRLSAWPSDPVDAYLRAHTAFRAAPDGGLESGVRVLVYSCTTMTFCGGHGDRLSGMLSAFVIALLSGRLFFIDSQRPVPMAMVLRPRGLDWRLYGTLAAMPAAFNLNDNLAGFEQDPRRVLENQAPVLRMVSNQRLTPAALRSAPQRAEAMGLAHRPKLHSELFHFLFEPSPALRRRLDARKLPDGKLIGIHFRAGDQMPKHWRDPPRHALAELEEFLDCAESMESSLGWSGDTHFVLFADTDRVLELPRVQALRESGKLFWPTEGDGLIHLDRSPATLSVRGLLSVWADWWTLAFDVHALVLCHSGFGATALEMGPSRPSMLGRGCVPADGSTG